MEIRKVEIDFSDAKVRWNPDQPEWAHIWNAMSTAVPYLEQFLIKVVRQHRDLVPETNVAQRKDVDDFIAQEGRHFKLHMKFNKVMRTEGYDFLDGMEAKIKADYDRYLNKKGKRFCLAYCEGFETFGPIISNLFFVHAPELMKNTDEASCYLWSWHIAEEFEHRTVVNYTYKEVYDDYWMRVYALWFAAVHLFTYALGGAWRLMNEDHAKGRIPHRWRSRRRYAKVAWKIVSFVVPAMITQAMRPSYDPGKLPKPESIFTLLDEASEKYGLVGAA